MANKIRLQTTLNFTDTTGTQTLSGDFTVTQVGSHVTQEVQDIGTSAEALDVGADIGTIGFLLIRNLDATNFVEVATDNGMANNVSKIGPGQHAAIVPKAGLTYYLKADTASVKVKFLAIEL